MDHAHEVGCQLIKSANTFRNYMFKFNHRMLEMQTHAYVLINEDLPPLEGLFT